MISVLRQGARAEPVTVNELRAHLRLDANEDNLLASLITSARMVVEAQAGIRLMRQEWDILLDDWQTSAGGVITLPHWPVMSVREIRLLAATPQIIADSEYQLLENSRPATILRTDGQAWPAPLRPRFGIMFTIIAGYGDNTTDVPDPLKNAVKMLASHWYEANEWNGQSITTVVPGQVNALMQPYRMMRI